jgi:hypothetical protein
LNKDLYSHALEEAKLNGERLEITDKEWKGPTINFITSNKVNPSFSKFAFDAKNLNTLVANQHSGTYKSKGFKKTIRVPRGINERYDF